MSRGPGPADPHLHVSQADEDLVREAADEAQAEPHEVVLLDEVVQVDAQQLEADAEVPAEVKVLLRVSECEGCSLSKVH